MQCQNFGLGKSLTAFMPADFYGTWCVGCSKVYPEVCRVAADASLRQKCHFVKVCQSCAHTQQQAAVLLVTTCPAHKQLLLGNVAQTCAVYMLSSFPLHKALSLPGS